MLSSNLIESVWSFLDFANCDLLVVNHWHFQILFLLNCNLGSPRFWYFINPFIIKTVFWIIFPWLIELFLQVFYWCTVTEKFMSNVCLIALFSSNPEMPMIAMVFIPRQFGKFPPELHREFLMEWNSRKDCRNVLIMVMKLFLKWQKCAPFACHLSKVRIFR